MSDPLTGLFGRLHDEPPPAPFAPAARVRRRGRQRSLRTAAAAMTAVVVTGVGSAAALAQFSPATAPSQHGTTAPTPATPPQSPSTQRPPTQNPPPATAPALVVPTRPASAPVPASALLTAAEVGSGVRAEPVDDLGPDGPAWLWAELDCPDYRPADYPSVRLRGPYQIRAFKHSGTAAAVQVVERYPAGGGAVNLADIRRVVAACGSFRVTGAPVYDDRSGMDHALELVDSGLAGDESLLIRHTSTHLQGRPLAAEPPSVAYHLVVRRGDLVATVTVEDGGESLARQLAARVADRLG